MFKRKPQYSLAEINEYIGHYEKLNRSQPTTPHDAAMRKVMAEVVQRLNEHLLKEGKR